MAADLGGLIFKAAIVAAFAGVVLALGLTHYWTAVAVLIVAGAVFAVWWQYAP